ncbi:biotin/lipoyl-containing protein [Cytophagaceae bacterium ABcell3]|nr:biotin/lipoyl-containing protein [Cytophagaceae bacterium ABcell3]
MLKIDINNKTSIRFRKEGETIYLNDTPFQPDIRQTGPNTYHIIWSGKSYNTEVVSYDKPTKRLTLKINNSIYELNVKDELDELLEKMGLNKAISNVVNEVKAPMPGLILDILVNEQSEVKKGDPVIVLEAMKMENIIKSPSDGVIKSINVTKGESVEKNKVLFQF